jgi:CheY-like chemotaxis protein
VSQLTTLLGGHIDLTSSAGQGSTFTVILPISMEEQPREQEDLPTWQDLPRLLPAAAGQFPPGVLPEPPAGAFQQGGSSQEQKRLLVVDDNPDVVLLVKAALEQTPFEVIGVQDPLQALEMAQTLRPYAITLDVMMPNLNGWQLLYHLKSDPATADVPVVMLTVLSERTTGYVLGADEYLIKPFDRTTLLKTLERLDHAAVPAREGIRH